jgi:small-conductance mechanosensitive channel
MQAYIWFLLVGCAAMAGGLRYFRPALGRELGAGSALLLLALLCQLSAMLASWRPQGALAGIFEGAAAVLVVLALIQCVVVWVFGDLLPTYGVVAPRIAQDLTVTALSLGWALVWLRWSGVDATQLFTTSAIVTAVIAFSMQDTLGNVLGGVMLQLDNSLRVGEWVRMDDTSGQVVDVRWRYTAIETRNGEIIVVPNSWLMKNRFGVLRKPAGGTWAWRRTLSFNVEPQADPATVIGALEQSVVGASIANVATHPPASAVLMETDSGYYRYALRYWLTEPRADDPTDSTVRIHALAALARAGISLGLTKEERLMVKENENWRLANERRDLQQRLDVVRRTVLFAMLPPEQQQVLAEHLVHAPFVQGDTLTKQGAVAHWLYLILRGQAQVQVEDGGVVTPVSMLSDGDFFGEMGMLTGAPRSATVVAVTDVDCYRLDKVGFAQVLATRPEMVGDISTILAKRREGLLASIRQVKKSTVTAPPEDLLAKIKAFFGMNA